MKAPINPNRLAADVRHGLGGTLLDRSKPLRFHLNGREVHGFAGDTVLSATLASGILTAGRHGEAPLALEAEFAPLIVVGRDTHDAHRALPMERTPALDGMQFSTLGSGYDPITPRGPLWAMRNLALGPSHTLNRRYGDDVGPTAPWLEAEIAETITADLVVIGGGIAGLAAAGMASGQGKRVVLLERQGMVGGAIDFFGAVDNEDGPEAQLTRLRAGLGGKLPVRVELYTEAFRTQGGAVFAHQVAVQAGQPIGRVLRIEATGIVIATGASERLPVFPGNRSPGVAGSLDTYQLARHYGVWRGRRMVVNTPHSFAYRLALRAQDAGLDVQRIVDARVGPHSRFIDFCKATGITLASGLIASEATPLKGKREGVRVDFAVAIDDISRDGAGIETDLLIAGGGWQPEIGLWLAAGGGAAWDDTNHWLAPRGRLEHILLVGAAAGWRSNAAAITSGRAAALELMGKAAPSVAEEAIPHIYETPDATTPIAPYRAQTQGTAYLDRGPSLVTRRAAAASKRGVSQLAALPTVLSLGDIAAAVEVGTLARRDVAAVAAERCSVGGDVVDTGWRVTATPAPATDAAPPSVPAWLAGRFGNKPQACTVTATDARSFGVGSLVFTSADVSDPLQAIGVVYAASHFIGEAGTVVINNPPETAETLIFVRDRTGPISARIARRFGAARFS